MYGQYMYVDIGYRTCVCVGMGGPVSVCDDNFARQMDKGWVHLCSLFMCLSFGACMAYSGVGMCKVYSTFLQWHD